MLRGGVTLTLSGVCGGYVIPARGSTISGNANVLSAGRVPVVVWLNSAARYLSKVSWASFRA